MPEVRSDIRKEGIEVIEEKKENKNWKSSARIKSARSNRNTEGG